MAGFLEVAALAEEVAATASKLKKRAAIASAISRVHAEGAGEEGLFCLYLAGLPFAEADARKLNAGGALLTKALLTVSGANNAELTAAYRRHGDLGAAGFDLLVNPTHRDEAAMNGAHGGLAGVPLREVETAFAAMAVAKTTAIRAALVEALLRAASPLEAKYLLKLMLGDMRIGVKQSLVEEAIAVAADADVVAVRHAVMLEADLGRATLRAFAGTLGEAKMTLFHPLGFMLASPVESPQEAVDRFTAKPPKTEKKPKAKKLKSKEEILIASPTSEDPDMGHPDMLRVPHDHVSAADVIVDGIPPVHEPRVKAFLEDKYDGMRAQVHCGAATQPGRVAIYSRNREDITESFPELVEAFTNIDGADGLIFDGEILGWDHAAGVALPFAVLGQRIGRKRVDNAMRRQVPVVFMAFDLMFADGELQLARPLSERRNRLEGIVEALVDRVQSPILFEEVKAQASLFGREPIQDDETVMNGARERLPRLMLSPSRLVESAEDIDRAYADARARSNEGVMLKAAESIYQPGRRGIAWVKLKRELATLDVVITGAEYGSGRRAQSLSDYTFAVRDAEGDLKNVGKAYSGVTDVEIAELTEFLKAHTLEDHGHFRTVEPLIVIEVAFNNIMRSDRHASGFTLRFPRILHIRRDKPLDEIDTVERVEEIYQSQVDKPNDKIITDHMD